MVQQPGTNVGEVWKRLMEQHGKDVSAEEQMKIGMSLAELVEQQKQAKIKAEDELTKMRAELEKAKTQEQTVQNTIVSDVKQKQQDLLNIFAPFTDEGSKKELVDAMESVVPTGTSLTDLAKHQRFFAGLARAGNNMREQMMLGKRGFESFREGRLEGDAQQPPEKGLKAINADLMRLAGQPAASLNATDKRFNPAQFATAAAPSAPTTNVPPKPAPGSLDSMLWSACLSGNLGAQAKKKTTSD